VPIQDNSYGSFSDIVKKLDQTTGIADFIFQKVWFETNAKDAERFSKEIFRESLFSVYPNLKKVSGTAIDSAYTNVKSLIASRKNKPIQRHELEKAIWDNVAPEMRPIPLIRIHTKHEHTETGNHGNGPLEFDWSLFSGGEERIYPRTEEWNKKIVEELIETRKWIISTKRNRRILLSGHRRLSASIAIGSVFSAVAGFNIDMDYRSVFWRTDDHPDPDTPYYLWETDFIRKEEKNEISVTIGIKRSVTDDVRRYLETCGLSAISQLHLYGNDVIYNAKHANKAVSQIKEEIQNSITKYGIKKIHLFIASPAHFALFLGHRLNAICEIQCYERTAPGEYTPSCLIKAF
jgi:hypothetical protein